MGEQGSWSEDRILDELITAHRHFVEGLTQQEVAALHQTSLATISRRIAEAEKKNYVRKRVWIVPPEGYEEKLLEWTDHLAIGNRLLEALNERGAALRAVRVVTGDVPTDLERPDAETDYRRLKRVTAYAARLVADQLTELDRIRPKKKDGRPERLRLGIGSGKTMLRLSEAFADQRHGGLRSLRRISIGGLHGPAWLDSEREPELAQTAMNVDCGVCVRNLSAAFSQDQDLYQHRIRIPAYLTDELFDPALAGSDSDNAITVIQRFFQSDPAYRSLFGDKPIFPSSGEVAEFVKRRAESLKSLKESEHQRLFGSILRYDMIVTGVGTLDADSTLLRSLTPGDRKTFAKELKRRSLCGNIAEHMFDNKGRVWRHGDGESSVASNYNSRLVGIWPEDLTSIADRHRSQVAGGVLMVAASAAKAEPLLVAATEHRVANEIVIDSNIAWQLYTFLGLEAHRDIDFVSLAGDEITSRIDLDKNLDAVRDPDVHDRYNSILTDDELLEKYYARKRRGKPVWQMERTLKKRGIQYG